MKKVISSRDVEDMLRKGVDLNSLPADALLTPSARDLVRGAYKLADHLLVILDSDLVVALPQAAT